MDRFIPVYLSLVLVCSANFIRQQQLGFAAVKKTTTILIDKFAIISWCEFYCDVACLSSCMVTWVMSNLNLV